jgi:hypothetical protein
MELVPLAGVETQADLTPFQIRVIATVQDNARQEAEADAQQTENPGTPQSGPGSFNKRSVSGGGGENRQVTRYRNLSHETGKSPEELIAEHKAQK